MKARKKNLEDYKAIKKMKKIARQELRRRGIKKISFFFKGKMYSIISKNYIKDDKDVFYLQGKEIIYFGDIYYLSKDYLIKPFKTKERTNFFLKGNEVMKDISNHFTEMNKRYATRRGKKIK